MPQPRKALISLGDTPYYHCMSRCVRRAFLCGKDTHTGNDYEHRRDWLEKKLHETTSSFAIRLCAYAVMNNHYHVVLNVREDIADSWTNLEVVKRWHKLFSGTAISQLYEVGAPLTSQEKNHVAQLVSLWRKRLTDISWFMRVVNESIARRANAEDQCTGRFWEGRFKSQALLDDKSLLSCMAYVDLNPIRSGIANSPETSNFTCVLQRIKNLKANCKQVETIENFIGARAEGKGLPFMLADYLELLDWTGRILRNEKRGYIDSRLPPILDRLKLDTKNWKTLTSHFETQFSHWVGAEHRVRLIYQAKHYQRIPSTKNHRTLLG